MVLKLSDLPEVSFAEKDINKILSDMISGYEQAYFEQTGEVKKLYPGDPIRIFLYSQALRELKLRVMIDDAAKQNLLKYARGDNLKNLGAFSRTEQFEAEYAIVTMKFNLSVARPTDEIIPAGTRVSPGNDIYFEVQEDTVVTAGATSIEFVTKCLQAGEIGNGFMPGQINILVDPIPWIGSVTNIDESAGGAELEDEDSYRNRIHLAPEGFSVAGPDGAYEYFVRQYSSLIHDVKIDSPSDGVVDIRVLLQNGELPDQTFLDGLIEHLSAKDKRPLTDKVQASGPNIVNYDINLTYYIRSEDSIAENDIKAKVEAAIEEYKVWQRSRIGRDINPSELITKIRIAGAKRVEIVSPTYTAIGGYDLGVANLSTVTYGGLEDE
jgi:phage-related baseplate assembly protein